MSEQRSTGPSTPGAETRQVAAEVLTALAWALTGAAAVIALGMFAVWVDLPGELGGEYETTATVYDFPGRYLFALLPLLISAGILRIKADALKPEITDPAAGVDWYRENES